MEITRTERLTPVELAFIGDAVYTLYVRERLVCSSDAVVGTLHTAATGYVNAGRQAAVYDALVSGGLLRDGELDIGRRAKNAHLHSRAKAASIGDYHKATALEAIIGYVHLSGDKSRESELLELCVKLSQSNK